MRRFHYEYDNLLPYALALSHSIDYIHFDTWDMSVGLVFIIQVNSIQIQRIVEYFNIGDDLRFRLLTAR